MLLRDLCTLHSDLCASGVGVSLDNDHLVLSEAELVDQPVIVSRVQLEGEGRQRHMTLCMS